MDLDGTWEATAADDELRRALHGDGEITNREWHELPVPGHWRDTPAFEANDGPLLYRTRFESSGGVVVGGGPGIAGDQRQWLVLDGIFYQGDVWLDGVYLGNTEGYFFPHSIEVSRQLSERSEHVLSVEVGSPRQHNRTEKRTITGVFSHWDCIDPDWNPGGIWRPVRLERTGPVRILHSRFLCTSAGTDLATIEIRLVLDSPTVTKVILRTRVAGVEHEHERTIAAGENRIEWTVSVPDPELWWPHALGKPVLHDLEVSVVEVDGTTSDSRVRKIGLRTFRMRNWISFVNDERLFLKGTNLAPTSRSLGSEPAESFATDVSLAKEAGLDLIRVHAHVSRPELYRAADEMGMLVWQDFPLQWGYSRSIRKQARRQAREMVDLLGNHPSVALWCGHNEPMAIDVGPDVWDDRREMARVAVRGAVGQLLPTWNKTVLDASIKRVIEHTDKSRPVVAHSGILPHLPQLDGTDTHVYFGWYHNTERDLTRAMRLWPRLARFVSEFGVQAIPESDEFMEPSRWPDLDWDRLQQHHALQKTLLDRFVPPTQNETFDEWRRRTQEYQALVVRRHIEELRRLKYRPTGGFCQFMLLDSQPAITWSVLDHNRVPKLGYEAVRQACAPVIVVADRMPDTLARGGRLDLNVHAVSDLRNDLPNVRCSARLHWRGGQQTWQWEGDLASDDCSFIGRISWVVPDNFSGEVTLDLELRRSGVIATNRDALRVP